MEVAAASLARWADTYLALEEGGSPALRAAYGAGSAGGAQATQVGGRMRCGPAPHLAGRAAEAHTLCLHNASRGLAARKPSAGPSVPAPASLQMLASLVLCALTRYPGERALHDVVCSRLLGALLRRGAGRAALLEAPAWHALCDAVGRGDAGLLQLEAKVQRRLLQSLLSAAGEGWHGDAGSWAGHLLESTAAQLRQLGASEAAARGALQRADGLHLASSLLERLRGAVRSTTPPTQAALFQQASPARRAVAAAFRAVPFRPPTVAQSSCCGRPLPGAACYVRQLTPGAPALKPCRLDPQPAAPQLLMQFTSVAPALATLFDACRTQPAAVTLILKLAGEVVECHAAYLSPPDAHALCSWALRLLQLYSANNLVGAINNCRGGGLAGPWRGCLERVGACVLGPLRARRQTAGCPILLVMLGRPLSA